MTFIRKNRILFGGGLVFVLYLIIALWIITSQASAQSSTWTVQTLKEYVDSRFDALKEAINKADAYTSYRDEKQNEFRGALDDANNKFALKEYVKAELDAIRSLMDANNKSNTSRIEKLESQMQKIENMKSGQSSTIAWVIAGVAFFGSVLIFSKNYIATIFKPK